MTAQARRRPARALAAPPRSAATCCTPGCRASAETRWRATASTATLPTAVRENEEVVPVNAVSTWVLPSGVTVGR
ncbi:hypothetical protein F6X68_00120 [Micromonospora sp. AMSO12t]|nr:hypothetical protein F6X68_00120 [Micromonospora sp. AMSO12t]